MKLLKTIPFFLFLLVLFFCLHGSVENYGYLDLYEVLEVAAIIILCIAVFFLLTWFVTKNYVLASLITFFISLWYLFFGAIHDLIKTTSFLQFLQSYTILLPVLLVVNILVIWWLKRKKPLHKKMLQYLNVLFLIFCIADGFLLINKHVKYEETVTSNPVNFRQSAVTQKPNVYFLLFDEYAGYKSLQDSFGFKNDSLFNFLQQQNFKVLPIFANYDFTPFCMSSMLNMQYVPENYQKYLLTQPDIQHRFGEIRNGQVFSVFKKMGYNIQNYSIFDVKGHPALYQSNGLFPIHAGLLTNKIFHKRLVKDIGWWFITGRFKLSFLKDRFLYRKDDYNLQVEQKVLKSLAAGSEKPKFCYAHFLMPHGQYFRDSSGAFNTPVQIADLDYRKNKHLYLSYLKYTNSIIESLVKKIVAADKQAIVIIMSDHGFYDYQVPGDYDPYNFDNMCLVRLPADKPAIKPPGSNVNFFRYLFNSEFGQNLPYLQDSTVRIIEDPVILR